MFNIARVASLSTFHKPKGILYQGGKKLVYEDNSEVTIFIVQTPSQFLELPYVDKRHDWKVIMY